MALWGDCNREVTRGINNSKQSGERTGSMGERDLASGNTQNQDTVLMCSSICVEWVTNSRVGKKEGKGTGDISGLRSC